MDHVVFNQGMGFYCKEHNCEKVKKVLSVLLIFFIYLCIFIQIYIVSLVSSSSPPPIYPFSSPGQFYIYFYFMYTCMILYDYMNSRTHT